MEDGGREKVRVSDGRGEGLNLRLLGVKMERGNRTPGSVGGLQQWKRRGKILLELRERNTALLTPGFESSEVHAAFRTDRAGR